uniref:Uncharacterized protein n=1 Tax=Arundo donax TaxID=35708 RepID=A0A0A8Z796_ARUDO
MGVQCGRKDNSKIIEEQVDCVTIVETSLILHTWRNAAKGQNPSYTQFKSQTWTLLYLMNSWIS